jgi:uncharacterized protein (DUF1684 family)
MKFNIPFLACALIISSIWVSCSNYTRKQDKKISEYAKNFYIQRASKDKEMLERKIIEAGKVKDFKGLQYFEPDSTYRVKASIMWLGGEEVVFQTNSERSPTYHKLFSLQFKLADSTYNLIAYSEDKEAKTGLFIPFKDKTNNKSTYGGGRYIEMPYHGEKDFLTLDFNECFNPYCHYNHGYSCPLVPYENSLNVAILAGEKKLYD